jgi:hypothetical protein
MPEDPKPAADQPIAQEPAQKIAGTERSSDHDPEKESEVGDFITRNVLDKDSVFFEG